MPTPAYPSSCPSLLLKRGYQETFPNVGVQTEMDSGVPKDRRRFSSNVTPIKGIEVMNDNQLQTFRNFYMNDCAGGTLAFKWTEQRTYSDPDSAPDTDTMTDVDLAGKAFNVAYFKFNRKDGPPTAREVGGAYEVSLSLLMLP